MASRSQSRTDVNRSAILAHLGAQGPTSRASLARSLMVSPALITQLTKQLIAEGLIQELEHTPSQGGRPARLIGLVEEAGNAIGVKVVADHITLVETSIDGTVTRQAREPYDAQRPTALTDLARIVKTFIQGGGERRLLGVGVGVPGSVDSQGEGMVDSSQLGWNQVPLGRTLRRELGQPVLVENNVNALAVAERLYGQGRNHQNLLVVTVGTGIGAAIVVEGAIVRGTTGTAGHIGHVPVLIDERPQCQCGNHGCLEAHISQSALVAKARDAQVIPAGAGISALKARADASDPTAQQIYSTAGHLLGSVLAGIVNTIDPEAVIVLGEGIDAWAHWSYGFEPTFRASLFPQLRGISVITESWQDDSWALGAASLVLGTPFDMAGVVGEQARLIRERMVGSSGAGIS